jgi:hypothetical protein
VAFDGNKTRRGQLDCEEPGTDDFASKVKPIYIGRRTAGILSTTQCSDTPPKGCHLNTNEYDQHPGMVMTDYRLLTHVNSQSSTTGKNSKECFAFPRQQSSILNSIAWTPVRKTYAKHNSEYPY